MKCENINLRTTFRSYANNLLGTTQFFILNSMRPEYNDKFIEAHLMGPAVFIQPPRNPLFKILLKHYALLKSTMEMIRVYKITFDNRIGVRVAELACRKDTVSTPMPCKILLSILDSNQINCVSIL